ncbi:MAG: hypothetical protein J6A77_00525 [Lachnospiraceae bacterium]|nr:hypothetical protein [Lachnospiraceae bacterium]
MNEKDTVYLESELLKSDSVEAFLKENEAELQTKNVQEYLMELLIQYNVDKKDVIRRSCLAPSYAHNIFNGDRPNVKRDKLIMIAFGFPLTLEETNRLLLYGGHSRLYVKNRRDTFIMFALEKKYDLMKTNEYLYAKNVDILE